MIWQVGSPGNTSGGVTQDDIEDNNLVRVDDEGFLIGPDGERLSGPFWVVDYAALVALDPLVYKRYVVILETDYSAWISNGIEFLPLNGSYIPDKQNTSVVKYVAPENVTWTAANNGGTVRITTGASANHGLTSLAVGAALKVKTTQNGWTADTFHTITALTTIAPYSVDLSTPFSAHGVPVFYVKNEEVILKQFVLPVLRKNTRYGLETIFVVSLDGSSSKRLRFYLGTTMLQDFNLTANTSQPFLAGFSNQDNVSNQRGLFGLNSPGTQSSQDPVSATGLYNTGVAGVVCSLRGLPANANVIMEVANYRLRVEG